MRVAKGDRAPLGKLQRRKSSRGPTAPARDRSTRRGPWSSAARPTPRRSSRCAPTDRPGLLQDIGITLARASLSVRSAHIATYAGQTLDTFYVTEFGGGQLAPARAAQAVAMIIDTCDAD